MKYAYPAILTEENGSVTVEIPDLGIHTYGDDLNDAIAMGSDALCLTLYDLEENQQDIPAASDIRTLKCTGNNFATLIVCDTIEYRKFFNHKSVKKTLTLPAWLNTMAERADVNFSVVLQEALKRELKI